MAGAWAVFGRWNTNLGSVVSKLKNETNENETKWTTGEYTYAEMILGFASRYACLGDLDKWAASRLQVACQ